MTLLHFLGLSAYTAVIRITIKALNSRKNQVGCSPRKCQILTQMRSVAEEGQATANPPCSEAVYFLQDLRKALLPLRSCWVCWQFVCRPKPMVTNLT